MDHPVIKISREKRKVVFLILLFFTLLVMLVLNLTGRALITDAAPGGILSYELAGSEEIAQKILDSWDELARIYAGFNLGLDYLFLVLYSTTIGLAVVWLIELLHLKGIGKRLAMLLSWGMLLAALLDALENAALFYMLPNRAFSPWPEISFVCAAIKFGLVILGLAFTIIGFFTFFWQSSRKGA